MLSSCFSYRFLFGSKNNDKNSTFRFISAASTLHHALRLKSSIAQRQRNQRKIICWPQPVSCASETEASWIGFEVRFFWHSMKRQRQSKKFSAWFLTGDSSVSIGAWSSNMGPSLPGDTLWEISTMAAARAACCSRTLRSNQSNCQDVAKRE